MAAPPEQEGEGTNIPQGSTADQETSSSPRLQDREGSSSDRAGDADKPSDKDKIEDGAKESKGEPSDKAKPDDGAKESAAEDDKKETKGEESGKEAAAITTDTEANATTTDMSEREESKEFSRRDSRPETSDMSTSSSKKEKKKKDKKDKDKEKKKEKKTRRKSRQSLDCSSVPRLRSRKSSKMDTGRSRLNQASGEKLLETVILSVFQRLDPEGTGFVEPSVFWELLESNLHLKKDELDHLRGLIQPDRSGLIPYAEFATQARDYFSSLYVNQPSSEYHWVELSTPDGVVSVIYNKQTGEVMEKQESGVDLFESVINDMYKRSDPEDKGYVTWEKFLQLLQSNEMAPFLGDNDVKEMKEFYDSIPGGKASYDNFHSLAKELILRVYRAREPSESPWCKIISEETGEMWFNKFNGEVHRGIQAGEREQEIAFINQAYAQVEEINFELEQYKEQCRVLENQLAITTEEQETLEAQLYETGQALDQANLEIFKKDNEVDQLKDKMKTKDQQAEILQVKLEDLNSLKRRLVETEQELQNARETIANRDSSITERDTNITSIQKQAEVVTDDLKTARGEIDAQESALAKARHQLQSELKKLGEYEKRVPELEDVLSSTKDKLDTTQQSFEEKTVALGQTRKHLKNARERNMDLEKEMEKMDQTTERLRNAESEVRTLKTFLTTKTALIEKHKKELRDSRLKVAELEEKDARRAVILADVLEKTARQYQQQLGGGQSLGRRVKFHPELVKLGDEEMRPYSAPAVPPESTHGGTDETDYHSPSPPRVVKSFTTEFSGPVLVHSKAIPNFDVPVKHRGGRTRVKNRSRTVPKLPLIKQQKSTSFFFSTSNDMRRENKLRDTMLIDHTPSNPKCACEFCMMSASVVGHPSSTRRPETGLTGMTAKSAGLPGYQGETDVRELALAEQLRIGQRVLVRMKKSEFDLEPMKLTGILKYIGKIDSEYVDHRIYAGVKLDEAVGDTDGLIKTKRYFTCPPKHGKLVRISNVIAVLPNKSTCYKPLQEITKRSPYTTVQKKNSNLRVSY